MPTATQTPELANEIVAGWLSDMPIDGWDSPAGPLFSGSDYAEYEITMTGGAGSNCSICTGSRPIQCC